MSVTREVFQPTKEMPINPIAYCILSFSQLRGGGGGGEGAFGQHPRKHNYDGLIDFKFSAANYWHKTIGK